MIRLVVRVFVLHVFCCTVREFTPGRGVEGANTTLESSTYTAFDVIDDTATPFASYDVTNETMLEEATVPISNYTEIDDETTAGSTTVVSFEGTTDLQYTTIATETTTMEYTTTAPEIITTTAMVHTTATTPLNADTTVTSAKDYCQREQMRHPGSNTTVFFPATAVGFSNTTEETCPAHTPNSGKPFGSRPCSPAGKWLDPNWLTSCDQDLAKLASKSIESDEERHQVASDLVVLTSNPAELNESAVQQSVEVLGKVTDAPSLNQNTSGLVVNMIGNLLQVPVEVLAESGTSDALLQSLEDVAAKVNLSDGSTFQSTQPAVAVAALITNSSDRNVGFSTNHPTDPDLGFRSDQFLVRKNTLEHIQTVSSIVLPLNALDSRVQGARVGFYGFVSAALFQVSGNNRSGSNPNHALPASATVNSPIVISASLPNATVEGLSSPVNITFKNSEGSSHTGSSGSTFCGFWEEKQRVWSTRGCRMVPSDSSTILCQCDHLTNFATLFAPPQSKWVANSLELDIFTFVACSVSAFACLLTIVCILHLWRIGKLPSQVRAFVLMTCLTTALLILNVFLLLSQLHQIKNSKILCQVIAALIHFALLSSLAWMMVEAVYLNVAVTKPMYFRFKMSNRKVYVFSMLWGWLMPTVFVLATFLADRSLYIRSDSACWIKSGFLMYLVVIPSAVILGVNLLCYVSIMLMLIFKKKPGKKTTANVNKKNLTFSFCLLITFGLTWIFGFFLYATSGLANYIFAYIFTILNAFQGFFVFFLFIVRRESIRLPLMHELRDILSPQTNTSQFLAEIRKRNKLYKGISSTATPKTKITGHREGTTDNNSNNSSVQSAAKPNVKNVL